MAHKLADEVLSMILAPSLTISDHHFRCTSLATWGSNDHISSSGVLLVCKRWLRIATPLIYEVAIIRSPGQAHALADALKQNPDFGRHVRKVRLEGAYSRLSEVFKRCPNVDSIFFTLWGITSKDNVNAFCRSLPIINPKTVIFMDHANNSVLIGENANKRKVFDALCNSIPAWDKLLQFHYPYKIGDDFWSLRLAKALKSSPTFEEIHSYTPYTWDAGWIELASNKRINFHFRDVAKAHQEEYEGLISMLTSRADLEGRIHFKADVKSTPPLDTQPSDPCDVDQILSPMASASPDITDRIWERVFEFAVLSGHSDDTQATIDILADHSKSYQIAWNRASISLVCKDWNRVLQRLLIRIPIIGSATELVFFAKLILTDPTIGSQVHIFSLNQMDQFPAELDPTLCEILPHLTRLRGFVSHSLCSISATALEALAVAAGDTLIKMLNVGIRSHDQKLWPAVFNRFKCLEAFEAWALPESDCDKSIAGTGCLSTIKRLSFGGPSSCGILFNSLFFPCLRSVGLPRATSRELAFLKLHGERLDALELFMVDLDGPGNCELNLLGPCSVLKTLKLWFGNTFGCPRFLDIYSGNDTLESILIVAHLGRVTEKQIIREVDNFFEMLRPDRFTNLKVIRFLDYAWPTQYRDIRRDHLVKKSQQIKERFGLDITDWSGKPFRPRVQARRGRR